MVDSPIPKMDFGFIGNLPGNYVAGQQVGRQRQLSNALGQLAPDDFQGMAKALMQFGDPEQGVRAMQLQNQLQNQAFERSIQQQTLDLNKGIKTHADERDAAEERRKAAEYAYPATVLGSGLKSYPSVREALLQPGVGGAWEANTGPARESLKLMILSLAQAKRLNAQQTKELLGAMMPGIGDISEEARRGKLELFENEVRGIAPVLAAGAPGQVNVQDLNIPQYIPPGTTVAPKGGPVQARAAPEPGGYEGRGPAPPPNLSGRALQFNPAMNLFRDKQTGELFNINGEPVSGQ